MYRLISHSLFLALALIVVAPVQARVWTDVTGNYTIEADLVGFDEKQVIVKREDKQLGSLPIEKLSKEDREFLKSKAAVKASQDNLNKLQTWTTNLTNYLHISRNCTLLEHPHGCD